eukprot:18573-Heterococcus_DN1.PRE.2
MSTSSSSQGYEGSEGAKTTNQKIANSSAELRASTIKNATQDLVKQCAEFCRSMILSLVALSCCAVSAADRVRQHEQALSKNEECS